MKRRKVLSTLAAGTAGLSLPVAARPDPSPARQAEGKAPVFRYCLNTSTISGQKPGIEQSIRIAAEAGYDGIEIWVRDLEAFVESGGSPRALRMLAEESGIRIESAIGFAPWMTGGSEGFRQMEREMKLLAETGCRRIAAPPAGVPADKPLDLFRTGEKYQELLELGRKTGVMPQLEFWGASPVLWHMGQVLMIAAVANDPDTRILPDIYHLFRGGSGFESLQMLSGSLIEIFHVNDYPGNKARENQTDADRVYPGDGAAPVVQVLQSLNDMGGEKVLSLELFNRGYWEEDMGKVARTGLQKMRETAARIT